jgi:uncharacterized protein (DUF2267 family)
MAEKDSESRKSTTPGPVKVALELAFKTPTKEQLLTRSTDELIRQLMSPEIAIPVNASLRQLIIQILQERKGNAFVQSLLGGKTTGKIDATDFLLIRTGI